MIEARGTPTGMITNESYENTHFYGCQDNGFARLRRIVFDEGFRAAYGAVGTRKDDDGGNRAWGSGCTPTEAGYRATGSAAVDSVTAANRTHVWEIVKYAKMPAVSPRLASRLTKTYNDSTDSMKWMEFDIWQMAARSMLEQADWALTGALTEADKNPSLVTGVERGALDWETKTFSGNNESEAVWAFNQYAMEENFGDGMMLVPPTPELVDEMMSGTTRKPDDILGTLKMRSGTITVEKVAINAVMAGCKPEHMPVLIAVAEILGNSSEEDFTWWHPMTSAAGGLGIIMLVSGPITEEIGMTSNVGEMGAGNPVNNTIGRAFRLMFRNFAHNLTPDIDTNGYGSRLSDRTMFAVAENYDVLKEIGWETHSEIMGFGENANSVTLFATGTAPHTQNGGAFDASWTVTSLRNYLSNAVPAPSIGSACVTAVGYSPAQARLLKTEYPTKKDLMDARQDSVAAAANSVERASFQFPLVIGSDPGGGYTFGSSFYVATGYQSQKITGATKTTAGGDLTAPSAPTDFVVSAPVLDTEADDGTYSVTLTWDEPETNGGSPITGYQVYYFEGTHDMAWRWLDVPGGADARTCYFTNLQPGIQYFFKVRAISDVDNARYYINRGGDSNMSNAPVRELVRFAKDLVSGTPKARAAGKGGWATAEPITMPGGPNTILTDNNYPQLNGQPIKLYWGYTVDSTITGLNPKSVFGQEDTYGPGVVYDYLGNPR